MNKKLKNAVERYCPEIDSETREDFFSRMDPDYFSQSSPEEVATHLRMTHRLRPDHPLELSITSKTGRLFDIVIVSYDHFSEFAIFCGLLAAFGLDIQSGAIYTFSEGPPTGLRKRQSPRTPGKSRRKIVDLFRVRLVEWAAFNETRQNEFEEELQKLIGLLDRKRFQEARERINRRLIESFSRVKEGLRGLLYPVEIRFANRASEAWTLLEIRSRDTPAFLYAFSNALAMRGIYIHRVKIDKIGSEAYDRLSVSDIRGAKIESKAEQDALKVAIAMIKQFTHFLASAPDPAKAIRQFDHLLDKLLAKGISGRPISFLKQKKALDLLARFLGASDFLWEDFLRIQFDNLLPVLQDINKKRQAQGKKQMHRALLRNLKDARTPEAQKRILNTFKDREMFRIDLRHLAAGGRDLMEFSRSLSDLTEMVLDQTYEICRRRLTRKYGRPLLKDGSLCPFSIFGLGKFGGQEMGYASDIELMFIYGGPGRTAGRHSTENSLYFEHLCQEILHMIETRREGIFHMDLRLRPDGDKGPLSNPVERIESYYHKTGQAAPFERQALTKLRWVAGDESLGHRVEAHRDRFVYSGEAWDLKTALHLRERQRRELAKPGTVNVKYSAGGVTDIEYAVQYLQIMNGWKEPALRTPSTVEGLEKLHRAKILSQTNWESLRAAYLFLRAMIDSLRIVRGHAKDLVLPKIPSEEFKFLARRMGYVGEDWEMSARKLERDIQTHMNNTRRFFADQFRKSAAD